MPKSSTFEFVFPYSYQDKNGRFILFGDLLVSSTIDFYRTGHVRVADVDSVRLRSEGEDISDFIAVACPELWEQLENAALQGAKDNFEENDQPCLQSH
jgi:hypothetical protein